MSDVTGGLEDKRLGNLDDRWQPIAAIAQFFARQVGAHRQTVGTRGQGGQPVGSTFTARFCARDPQVETAVDITLDPRRPITNGIAVDWVLRRRVRPSDAKRCLHHPLYRCL